MPARTACQLDLAASLTDIKIVTCLCTSEFAEQLVYQMLVEGPEIRGAAGGAHL